MSVSGHACRHALQHVPSRLDYVWISDELLSLTFRRFVKGQRRYGSRVPGPLEARNRLAKRRNTALAVTGSSFDPAAHVAHLFGANGKGHLRQWDDSPWSSRWPEPLEIFSYSDQPPTPPGPSFLAHGDSSGVAPSETTNFIANPTVAESLTFASSLIALEWYQIDLRKDPECSRMIFSHFYKLAFITNDTSGIRNLIEFMNDASLNIYGVGNYADLFERLSISSLDTSSKNMLVDTVTKAIGLGLVPITEITPILRYLPASICGREWSRQTGTLIQTFYDIWGSVQSCSVFKLHEIYHSLLQPWVEQLMTFNDDRYLRLAREILLAYYDSLRTLSLSMSSRVFQILSSRGGLDRGIFETSLDRALMFGDKPSLQFANDIIVTYHRYEQTPSNSIANILLRYLVHEDNFASSTGKSAEILPDLLRQLSVDVAAKYIILMAENLAFLRRDGPLRSQALKALRHCVMHTDRPSILSSQAWSELQGSDSLKASKGLRFALRIWTWSALSTTPHRRITRSQPVNLQSKKAHATGVSILKLFDDATTSIVWRSHGNRTELLPKLIVGLQKLQVPSNQVLRKVYTLLSHRQIKNASTLQSFRKLEEGLITLEQAALQQHVFNSTKFYLLSSHLRVIENVDVTSPSFIEDMISMIEKDNRAMRQIIFLISFHTPLKVALAMASARKDINNNVPNTKRIKSILRLESKGKQLYLEPQACVSFIHFLTATIATSDKVSPRAAFNLVSYLYRYLIVHNGPVQPNFARAMYHCGVTRFVQSGLHVSRAQEDYVMHVVRRHEEPEAVRGLLNGSFLETVH
ncbi:hypothetical protein UA08_08995 [Talaromyces atroroseus]|uniref:Uncharacterized protein n=1 Tax=Talaromyces atroroseus TaxID=1441469 RepID=A0A1Q5Q7E1_TALAT|nr:hypothetical protein UA08_08995 [Talaromyces atroroseus]OKL55769.1 hypothetical protein UA08_08995 [Talaromyces atroroseus]